MIKYNVHEWDGFKYNYIGTVKSISRYSAAQKIGRIGSFAVYTHIDNIELDSQDSIFVTIH